MPSTLTKTSRNESATDSGNNPNGGVRSPPRAFRPPPDGFVDAIDGVAAIVDCESDLPSPHLSPFRLVNFLLREWPYLTMLALALFGVAYTSISRQGMVTYWIILAPFFGLISVLARWRDVQSVKARWQLFQTQGLHWLAVILATYLIFVSDVENIMNSDASALMVMTVLALGTFTAGVIAHAWRICVVGVALGLAVPAIAWLEEATLLLMLLVVLAMSALVGLFYLHARSREVDHQWQRSHRMQQAHPGAKA
jgi:hypothetical protein